MCLETGMQTAEVYPRKTREARVGAVHMHTFSIFETGSCYVDEASLKLAICSSGLPQIPDFWGEGKC